MADRSKPANLMPATEVASEPSDAELVARVQEGEEAAFEELFKRHRRRVALIAGRFFRQREEIEEVLQESFTKAFFALEDFSNRQETSFAAWLARIAFNVCYDELRRARRRPESAAEDLSAEEAARLKEQMHAGHSAGDIEAAAITRDLAAKLLSRLGTEDRLVLIMLDAEGMSVSEVAEALGWSVPKVKVRAHRARAGLRRVLRKFL